MEPLEVEVLRGARVESRHQVHALWVDSQGRSLQTWGDEEKMICPRSSLKPIQALPLVLSRGFEKSNDPLSAIAIACASHKAQKIHLDFVRGWLAQLGRSESDLVCGPQPPSDLAQMRELVEQNQKVTRVRNNCSGKHTGFLAACLALKLDFHGYHLWDHPLQIQIREKAKFLSNFDWDRAPYGIDGCGIPTYFIPLNVFAMTMSAFLRPEKTPWSEALNLIIKAWQQRPVMIAGDGHLCTELARVTSGRVIAKVGAQGNYLALDFERAKCLVLKVEDGNARASEEALLKLLLDAGSLTSGEEAALRKWVPSGISNWAGDLVGTVQLQIPGKG